MKTRSINNAAAVAVLLSAGLVACSDEQSATPSNVAQIDQNGVLSYVPADSPYLLAATKPFPEDLRERYWAMAASSLTELQAALTEQLNEGSTGEPLLDAMLRELDGKLTRDGLKSFGIDEAGQFAIYGLDVLPVIRASLDDSLAFRDAIARIEADAGQQIPTGEIDGQSYWRLGEPGGAVYMAIIDEQTLVITLMPTELESSVLPLALGQTMPEDAMSDDGAVLQMMGKYGFLEQAFGFLDFEGLAKLMLTDQGPVMSWMRKEAEIDLTEFGEQCQSETMDLVAIAPRMVFGVTQIDNMRVEQRSVIELETGLAGQLMETAVNVPGLGQINDALMSMGLGIDLMKGKKLLLQQVNAMTAEPSQCQHFAQMRAGLEDMKTQLLQPLPPVVGNIKGANIVLSELNFTPDQAIDVDGMVALRIDNPKLMLGMAQAMMPELAELQLNDDGEPMPIPASIRIPNAPHIESPHMAMNDRAVGFSLGEGQQYGLKAFIESDSVASKPILAAGYKGELFERIANLAIENLDPAEAAEVEQSLLSMRETYVKHIDYINITVAFSAEGIDMLQTTDFKPAGQ